ncbi:MAG: DNA repair protein RecN [Gammaproteobacteria bacterium]|nr:DNA repair protein RecN [Gammaproteobacteria bacterium]
MRHHNEDTHVVITDLYIRDFAIVRQLELNFGDRFSVLTGETGAGKSILVDALGLALGGRTESGTVRHGCERAEIIATFTITAGDEAAAWLETNELNDAGSCVLKRIIWTDKPSKASINGRPVPASQLRALGDLLVDIHGQHEHQSLLQRDAQRRIVDEYAGLSGQCEQLLTCFLDWKQHADRLAALRSRAGQGGGDAELLRHHIAELDALAMQDDEYRRLSDELRRVAHSTDLTDGIRHSLDQLYDDDQGAISTALGAVTARLDTLTQFDHRLGAVTELLEQAQLHVTEAALALREQASSEETDPERRDWLERRVQSWHDLARKHRVDPDQLPATLDTLQSSLAELENVDNHIAQTEQELNALRIDYEKLAEGLSKARAAAGAELSAKVTSHMEELAMPAGEFRVAIDNQRRDTPTRYGFDEVQFIVTANPGQPLQPLSKVASGGELSRISLAIQVATAAIARIPCLVFDEVDVGIGGRVAEIVGKRLRELGRDRQILCVTHLPQVAAQAHNQFQIQKQPGKMPNITVHNLSSSERIEEIARMLGGIEITDRSIAHAEQLLERASG